MKAYKHPIRGMASIYPVFQNKNYLPLPEPEISILARQMRKRLSFENTLLHVQKTINKTIYNEDLFQPVYVPRTLQSEYLIWIDESNANDQMVKLFDYLVEILRKQDVLIDKYYYRQERSYVTMPMNLMESILGN